MQALERLTQLAKLGDLAAAEHLWVEATRRDDMSLKITAAQALCDPARAGEVASILWTQNNWTLLTPFFTSLGVELSPSSAKKLLDQLDEAHGIRRVRLLTRAQLCAALFEARWGDTNNSSNAAAVCTHAGTKKGGAFNSPQTTICIAVYLPTHQTLTVAIQSASAASPSPSAIWPQELRPWSKDFSKNLSRLSAWASKNTPDRIQIPTSPTTASLSQTQQNPQILASIAQLKTLLESTPSTQHFKAIIALLDKWPKDEKADLENALSLTHECLAKWPDDTRIITRLAFSRTLNNPDTPRPGDAFYKHLDLSELSVNDIFALSRWPLSPQITHLSLTLRTQEELDALSETRAALPNLQSLKLSDGISFMRERTAIDLLMSSPWPSLRMLDFSDFNPFIHSPTPPLLLSTIHTLSISSLTHTNTRYSRTSNTDPKVENWIHTAPLSALESLRLRDGASFHVWAANPQLKNLREIILSGGTSDAGLQSLADNPNIALETIQCERVEPPTTATLRALINGPTQHTLKHLKLTISTHGPKADAVCTVLQNAPNLESLDLEPAYGATSKITSTGLLDLIKNRPPKLKKLSLRASQIADEGLIALVNSEASAALESLHLFNSNISNAGLIALANSPHLTHLRDLNVGFNKAIDSVGFKALVESPHLTALTTLNLDHCQIDASGIQAFAESHHLQNLRVIMLAENPLGNASAELLANAPLLARLHRIHLYRTGIKKPGIQALEASQWLKGRFDGLPGHSSYIEVPPGALPPT